jgi:hypothetical protein
MEHYISIHGCYAIPSIIKGSALVIAHWIVLAWDFNFEDVAISSWLYVARRAECEISQPAASFLERDILSNKYEACDRTATVLACLFFGKSNLDSAYSPDLEWRFANLDAT